jgi:hypothetical protein
MSEGVLAGNVRGMWLVQATFDPANIATITTAESTATVPGLRTTDFVFASKPTLTAGLGIAGMRVSAADTLAVTFVNPTAGGVNAASETWTFLVVRASGSLPTGFSD